MKCDNRGSARRGLAFEGALKNDMGNIEVCDQKSAVDFVTQIGIGTKSKGVAIYGWSYGGYMAGMCLAKAPETFTVAVLGAPVTSWDGYDSHYTERYMSTPQLNPIGYESSSLLHNTKYIKDDAQILIVHGLIDENVHWRHSARFIDKLVESNKRYQLVVLPGERHSPRSTSTRLYIEHRVADFLVANLKGGNGDGNNSSPEKMNAAGVNPNAKM